jgi:hypothetical protein
MVIIFHVYFLDCLLDECRGKFSVVHYVIPVVLGHKPVCKKSRGEHFLPFKPKLDYPTF